MDGALWGALRPRGIPRLRESDVGPITLIGRSGKNMPAGDPPPKPLPLASVLTLALGPGDQLIFDAGAFCLAYSMLDMDAETGTEIELEYAQRYFETDRRPEGSYGRVNRYIARGGRQTYMNGDTFGFKYLVLRLKSGQATLHGLRLVNRLYYIEDYSCLWVQALREYSDHTDDLELARELWPALTAQLQWFLDRRSTNGLVNAREFVYFSNPLLYRVCEGATLNAFLHRALQDASFLADRLGRMDQAAIYRDAADGLRHAVNDRLWDAASGTYFGSLTDGETTPPTAHAALFCLHFGIVPSERETPTRRWLLANYRHEGFYPYTHQFLLEEIYSAETDATDREALDLIRSRWAAMAQSETGTVWEGFGPGENCHEAGAVPAYFLSAYVLGVRLDGPVSARRLLIQPRLGDLTEAEGTVVTELGPVPVRWRRDVVESKLDFDFEIPDGVRATVALPFPGEKPQVRINGRVLAPADWKIAGRHVLLELDPGVHRGQCSHQP